MNRYATATAAEKKVFTTLQKVLLAHTPFAVAQRELKGEKSKVKYIFDLKANNPHIHQLEFGTKNGEVVNIRMVVSRPTIKTDFYKALFKGKSEAKASYGGVVVHFDATTDSAPDTLKLIAKLAEASDEVALDPKRTYCDPPCNWVDGNDGKVGVVRNEKKAKEEAPKVEAEAPAKPKAKKAPKKTEKPAEAPAEAPAEEATPELSAKAQAKADIELA